MINIKDKAILRDHCVVCGKKDLEIVYEYPSFPVFIGCTSQDIEKDKFADLKICISKSSGVLQLSNLLPLDLVYSEYHSEALGGVWGNHHSEFCEFIISNSSGSLVTEIGGSNCRLAELCLAEKPSLKWTVVEPNSSLDKHDSIVIHSAYIEEKLDLISSSDTITHSHVLEHLYKPMDFMEKMSKGQNCGDRIIFSVPNLMSYLENKFVNTLNFEHTYFLTEEVVMYMLEKYSYTLVDKIYFSNHSIFYAFEKSGKINQKTKKMVSFYQRNKNLYFKMISFYKNEVKRLNNIIEKHTGEVFIFGAHIFTQYLTYLGLNPSRIQSILDNSNLKCGKRLYGNQLRVQHPSVIKGLDKPLVIVKAGQYQDEVEYQLREINNSVIIR